MKKIAFVFAAIAILMTATVGSASTPSVANLDAKAFTFAELGYADRLLVGPYDTSYMYFSLPPTWSLKAGGEISLTFTHVLSGGVVANNSNSTWIGGSLLVFYNGQLIDTILLDTVGETTKVIQIPERGYDTVTSDGRQDIRFFLDASTTCDYDSVQSSVLIQSSVSFVDFSYNLVPPATDLTLFPRPIYQTSSMVPNQAKIVVPDSPTAAELQAALAVSAGLGSLTNNKIDIELLQSKNLSDAIRSNEHLIFVGQATSFPILDGVQLPVPVNAQTGIKHASIGADDGVVQIAQSPWDSAHVIMLVSGNTDMAVTKAGEAFSTGVLIPSGQKDFSIIASTSVPTQPEVIAEDFTLAEFGTDTFTLGSYNGNYFSFSFYVSADQVLAEDAYFDLIASYSDLMNQDQTAMTILLNETTIGSVSFADAGDAIFTRKLEILPNILRRGRNELTIYSSLIPADNCYAPDLEATWVTISGESAFHLPISTRNMKLGSQINLGDFPAIVLQGDSLEDFAVILPKDDFVSWDKASQVVSNLGAVAAIPIANLSVAYADDVPEEFLKEKNLLVIGQASTLPFLSELNSFLPAPFAAGSNEAEQPTLLVNYRLLPDVSVGYLQLLPSPWNLENVILTVMGNSQAGIPMATDALLIGALNTQLAGNFSILYGDQVLSTDTRLGPTRDGLMAELPETAVTVEEVSPSVGEPAPEPAMPPVAGSPNWMIPAFGVSSLFILLLVIFILRRESATRIKPEKEE